MANDHDSGQVAASAAEIYEQFFVPALFAGWPGHVLKASGVRPGDALLDVACGTGVLAREAAKVVGENGSVAGVDINHQMIAVARRNSPGISWQTAPAEELPYEAATFDRVVSQFGLMFFADQSKALAEMKRVLRPGGSLAVAVWDSLEAAPGYAVMAEVLDELFGSEAAQSIEAPFSLGDAGMLRALFAGAGMDEITLQTVPGVARFPSLEAWLYTEIRGWTLADKISDEDYERLRRHAHSKLSRFVGASGSVSFAAPAHIVSLNGAMRGT